MTRDKQSEREFNIAYEKYWKELKNYSFSKLHSRALSEDTVQNAFMKTWQYLVRGGKIILMKAFLYRVLNNLIVDEYRKNKSTVSLDTLLEDGMEPDQESKLLVESESLINALDGKTAVGYIKRLPEKYRNVMNMLYVQNLSLGEIAAKTGKSRNIMTVRVHRGIKKLKILYNTAPAQTVVSR